MTNQVALESENEIKEIKKEIDAIENGISSGLVTKLFSETKKSTLLYLAEKYERLYELKASEIPTNQIANYLVKKFDNMNIKISTSNLYEALPSKYKTHKPNPVIDDSVERNENSSFINYEEENELFLELIEEIENTWKNIKTKLKTSQFLKKKDDEGNYLLDQKQIHEDIKLIRASNQFVNEMFDDRVTMAISTQYMAVRIFGEEASKYAASVYVSRLKELGNAKIKEARDNLTRLMSFKQFRKLLTGHVKNLIPLYIPKNKGEAILKGYYGVQCKNMQCKSWRVFFEDVLEDGVMKKLCKCYECNAKPFKPITEVLPKETPQITIDWHLH